MTAHSDFTPRSAAAMHRKTVVLPREENLPRDEEYEIIEQIASGGMGVVYLARDPKLGRYVALKRLNREFWANALMKERFLREAKSIASLNHPHIVHVYALAQDSKGPFIAMEYIPGGPGDAAGRPGPPMTLEDKVNRDGPLSLEDAIHLMIKLCSALQYAHGRGVIHRDLKPSNVLLTETGEPRVVDFGLARRHGTDDNITLTGTKMISLGYSAPEQETDASSVDERADVYSLGGVLYFTLTGENPRFYRENRVPDHLKSAVGKALESDLSRRWPSVEEFEEALFQSGVIAPDGAERGSWWCKWCHAINPLARRYCVECGWDGLEYCGECNAELRIGVQFCGSCGTDAKAMEVARRVLTRMRDYDSKAQFNLLREEAGAVPFQPKGETGRAMLTEISQLRDRAERSLRRRDELHTLIAHERKRGNYDRLAALLDEFARLDKSGEFDAIRAELPGRIAEQELSRARFAANVGNYHIAEQICRDVLKRGGSANEDAKQILRQVTTRRKTRQMFRLGAVALCLVFLYFVSSGPLLYVSGRWTSPMARRTARLLYAPVAWCHEYTLLHMPLQWLTELWGVSLVPEAETAGSITPSATSAPAPTTPAPKPAVPAPKPTPPVPTPAVPAPKPTPPAPTPAVPAPKPTPPVPTPAAPKPAVPAQKPATPVPTPAAPTPAVPAQKPATPAPPTAPGR